MQARAATLPITLPDTPRCALCGADDIEVLQTQSLALVGLGQQELTFGICKQCGHLQQSPPAPPDVMQRHYEFFSHYTLSDDMESVRSAPPGPQTKRLLSITRDVGAVPGRMYEIGCATGLHLHQFRKLGWSVGGCDPSPKTVSQAKTIYSIDLDVGGEEECLSKQSALDLVLMSHVLEHLYDPVGTLGRAHAALIDQGVLVLEVPCAVAPDLLPPGWFAFEHLHYFSPEVLEALLISSGFEILEIRIAMRAFIYPVIAIAARKAARPLPTPILPKPETTLSIAKSFVVRDAARWKKMRERLAELSGEVFIWGAGVHTALLLFHTNLTDYATVAAITDRDSQKWGHTQAGVAVISPEDLLARASTAPIIVSSYYSEREIAHSLRQAGVSPDRIITLYD